jgi:hypothetical protein
VVENLRQLLPSAALRSDVAGGIPDRQSREKLRSRSLIMRVVSSRRAQGASTTRHAQQLTRSGAPTSTDLARYVVRDEGGRACARRRSGIVGPSVNHP